MTLELDRGSLRAPGLRIRYASLPLIFVGDAAHLERPTGSLS